MQLEYHDVDRKVRRVLVDRRYGMHPISPSPDGKLVAVRLPTPQGMERAQAVDVKGERIVVVNHRGEVTDGVDGFTSARDYGPWARGPISAGRIGNPPRRKRTHRWGPGRRRLPGRFVHVYNEKLDERPRRFFGPPAVVYWT